MEICYYYRVRDIRKYIKTGGVNLKKYKGLSLLVVVILMASLLTGCSREEKEFVDALVKSQEIVSNESISNMSFNLKAEGLDDETQVIFDQFIDQLNDMKLSVKQKAVTNKEQSVAKAQVDVNVKLTDMSFDSSIWVDMDMSGEEMVFQEIFKLPAMLMNLIPGGADKEYIVLDLNEMNESIAGMEETMSGQLNLDETMAIAMKYQEKFKDAFVDYIKKYDFDRSVVTKLEDKTVDGDKVKYYQIAFDNESFKDFIKYTTISMLEDKNVLALFESYMSELMTASGEEMPEELSIIKNIPEMIKQTKEFFEKIEGLTILGKDGILITYGINKDGYFVSEEGKMDFIIDTKQLASIFSDLTEANELMNEMPTPVFEFSVSYDSKIKNINEDLEIAMPVMTKENAIDYMDLIEGMVSEMVPTTENELVVESGQERELMVIVEDELVEFTNEPILVDNHYLFSTRDMGEALGATVSWNEETKEIVIVKDDKEVIVNKAVIRDSISYIPLRAIATDFGYTLEWEEDLQMIYMYR